ncbi:MAG: hypothetical protein LLG06_13795, partial [Desulfobacteraceae bacterium]|nr:hypothetical protein [Desulfobacteraceae bacterium]
QAAVAAAKAQVEEARKLGAEEIAAAEKLVKVREKIAELAAEEKTANLSVEYAKLTGTMEDQLRVAILLLNAEKARALAAADNEEQQQLIKKIYAERVRLKNIDLGTYGDWEAFKQGIKDATNAYETSAMSMRKTANGLVSDLNSEFSSFFQKAWKGELKTAEDYFDAFCDAIGNAFSKALSNMMADMMTSGLKSIFGGSGLGDIFGSLFGGGSSSAASFDNSAAIGRALGFHSGGIVGNGGTTRPVNPLVFVGAPRLHSGLASDEFPAILQRGELVIPKGAVKAADSNQSARPLSVQIQIDNQSSTPLKLEQSFMNQGLDKIVVGIVAKDIDSYGVLGRMLRSRKS